MITIRKVTPADADSVAGLSHQLGYPASQSEMEKSIRGILDDSARACFVAEQEHQVIGWVQVFLSPLFTRDRDAEVGGLIVDKEHRRSGAGMLLMERAEQWSRENGCRSVFLRSNIVRNDAHDFYESLRYTITKTQSMFRKQL